MLKKNSGIVVVEALLIMSILALFGIVSKNNTLSKEVVEQEQRIEECEKLEDFVDHMEYKKYKK